MQHVWEFLAGVAAGIFAGLTGAGGGLLLVPVLVLFGLPPISAIATSNLAIVVTASSGTVTNSVRFGLNWRRVAELAVPAVILAPLGVWLAGALPATVLLLAFAAFNLVNIPLIGRRPGSTGGVSAAGSAAVGTPSDGLDSPQGIRQEIPKAIATGAGAGVLAGLFGVGGGLIMVPMQVLLLSTPVRVASRISLAVVVFASASALITHSFSAGVVHWVTGLVIAAGGLLGAPVGASLLHRMSDRVATRMFQVTMACVAAIFVWKALG
ncbi:MAG TPA: sulfite exporter TauE/SafE family protein [Actinomycetota bacterium]|nr:sulfite exporter TauE/SafE family protein [Actinomycetota bacterium]